MTFLSYAQNGEDVVLWRALRDVVDGQYIDVGAADPTSDSVTRAFYERGWHGINIEPEPELHSRLVAARPRDANLQVGLAATPGEASFFLVGHKSGLSTFDAKIAESHSDAGLASTIITVALRTLADVCEEHVHAPILFLKIDVEGFEREVIEGADFTRWRPWVILVEATFPNSQQPTHQLWEPLLCEAGYKFALFDGLNRFYVASEHCDHLYTKLSFPACVHDDYVTEWEAAGRKRVEDLESLLQQREAEVTSHVDQLRRDVSSMHRGLAQKDEDIEVLRGQLSGRDVVIAERDDLIEVLRRQATDRNARLDAGDKQIASLVGDRSVMSQRILVLEGALSAEKQRVLDLESELSAANRRVLDLDGELSAAKQRVLILDVELSAANHKIESLYASTSWRVTAPLRGLKKVIA